MSEKTTSQAIPLALSLSQREVWLDQRAWPDSAHLIIGGGGFLSGPVDIACLQAALEILAASNDALRLAPRLDGGQQLLTAFKPKLEIVDLTGETDPKEATRLWWRNSLERPFALDGTPPWRFSLLRAREDLHGWTIQFHHLVMDGWGTSIVVQRWAEIYSALVAGTRVPVIEALSYTEFIEESNAYRQSPAFIKDAEFWSSRIEKFPDPFIERTRQFSPTAGLSRAELIVQPIKRAAYDAIERFARTQGVTSFNLFLVVLAIYFARTRSRREIVIGIPSLNRSGKRFKSTLGMFVGVFPVMVEVCQGASFTDIVSAVSASLRAALRHARYPLSELGKSAVGNRFGPDGIFDILLSFERQDYDVFFGEAKNIDTRQAFSGVARYPLSATVCDFQADHDVELVLEVSTACFAAAESQLLGGRLLSLLEELIAAPDMPIESLPVVSAEERWALVEGLHERVAVHNSAHCFIAQFEHHAKLRPDAVALVWDGGQMSYVELSQAAIALGVTLRELGAGRDKVVAIAIERSAQMMMALLGTARSGAAFLPLDLDAPVDRIAEILQDSGAIALLVKEESRERYQSLGIRLISVSADPLAPAPAEAWVPPALDDLAYVLFTSGSTGRPKGVMVEHDALARRLASISKTFEVTSKDRSGQGTQYTFDPSLIELLVPLVNGGSVALPPPGRLLPETLADFAIRHHVTFMAFVPSTLSRFLDGLEDKTGSQLRVACCGGEVLSPALANRFLRQTGARLFNVYGPTETVIFSTAWPVEERDANSVLPVGSPTDDSRVYVLDGALMPQPFGVAGDIYIGGRSISRGYLNRPELDEAFFYADPFLQGHRVYRTGDRGYLDTDGNLHFLGRMDRQIKLRGYRIELGEIEARLLAIPGVPQAAVKLCKRHGKDVIEAWVASTVVCADDVRRSLRKRLPDYMMPATIMVLSQLPETPTGKLDYDALPTPPDSPEPHLSRAPVNDLERSLLAIWEAALKIGAIGIKDNFFDLGGDSLAAIDILASIEALVGHRPSLFLLTENPTIELLAAALGDRVESAKAMLRLSSKSGGVPLFVAASGHGDLLRFQSLARHLGDACDVYMLQPPNAGSSRTIQELAARYVQEIEAHGGKAGYIAGFSVGGVSALETARLLHQRGVPIRGLILLDTVYPAGLFFGFLFWRILGWLASHIHLKDLSINGRRLGSMFGDPGLVAQVEALKSYRPKSFAGRTLLIKSAGLSYWQFWLFRSWRRLLKNRIDEKQVNGLHGSIFEPWNITQLAEAISRHCHQS